MHAFRHRARKYSRSMPLLTSSVGRRSRPVRHHVDPRWTMAFAAALGDMDPHYLDNRAGRAVVAHPMFPNCLEWGTFQEAGVPGSETLDDDEAVRAVHGTYELELSRPLWSGEVLTSQVSVEVVERRRPGGYRVVRIDGTDEAGTPVWVGRWGQLYLGIDVDDDAGTSAAAANPAAAGVASGTPGDPQKEGVESETTIPLPANFAHTYTECARIWNPIHTDAGVAERAGLPGPILHGSATLAVAVSRVVADHAGGDPTQVRRIVGRFGAMVRLPSELRLQVTSVTPRAGRRAVTFHVLNADGGQAVRDGLVELG
ncbi:MAG: hypothetical protein GEV03_14915 [Streptosporangiales bacterium]|nr:hypothetical protein [Streptosporangiales bacterium]